jgi:poly-gamma-glutamate capsule biosynthesis protein CapA/YwtB (metallophosphatase superfamily)
MWSMPPLLLAALLAQSETVPPPSVENAEAKRLVTEGRAVMHDKGESGAAEATALYEKALASDPQNTAALWELGWSLQTAGDYARAVAAWDKLRALAPLYPELDRYYPLLLTRREQAERLAKLPPEEPAKPREEEPAKGPTLTITAVGDVQMGTAWPEAQAQLPPEGGRPLFANVSDVLQQAELTFGNAETVFADSGTSTKCGQHASSCFAFRAPTAFAATLKQVGFAVVSNANNHAGDFGPEARQETLRALDAAGLRHAGPAGDVATWEQNGRKIALIAFATGSDNYRVQEIDTARRLVADLRQRHDLIIVSMHAGAEGVKATHVTKARETFFSEDRGNVYAFAHGMIDAGADLVLGSGPHVLRGVEVYRGRFIAYSLGNFCSWHGFSLNGPTAVSAILEVKLAANGVALAAKLRPLVLDQPGVPRPDPSGQAIALVRQLSRQDLGAAVFDERGVYERPSPTLAAP